MTIANKPNTLSELIGLGIIKPGSDQLRITLHNGYTFNPAHTQFSDVASSELPTDAGYTQQNEVLANTSWTQLNGFSRLLADNIRWVAAGGTLGPTTGAWLYSQTALNQRLMVYYDFEGSLTAVVGQPLDIEWVGSVLEMQ